MFVKLKKFLLGDPKPTVESVAHPVLGLLTYSEDDDAWLTDPSLAACGFGFYIAGEIDKNDQIYHPSPALIEHAASIASNPGPLVCLVEQFIVSQLQGVRDLTRYRDEVEQLRIYRIDLMWPDRPDDGEIELRTSADSEQMWGCAYIGRKPAPHLCRDR